jgi:hypothetical protein
VINEFDGRGDVMTKRSGLDNYEDIAGPMRRAAPELKARAVRIDNLHFVLTPDRFLPDAAAHVEAARVAFLIAGWDGEGEIGLLWLPPFVFPLDLQSSWTGVVLWHVKQVEDGTSWLLSPIELPFKGFARWLA